MTDEHGDETDLLDVERNFDRYAPLAVGGAVVLERRGVAQRLCRVTAIDDTTVTLGNGMVYDLQDGRRVMPARPSLFRIRPLRRDDLHDLILRQYVRGVGNMNLRTLGKDERESLGVLARQFLEYARARRLDGPGCAATLPTASTEKEAEGR